MMLLYGKKVTRLTAGHFCDVSKLIVYDTVNNDLQKKVIRCIRDNHFK